MPANDNSPAWIMDARRRPARLNTFKPKRNTDFASIGIAWIYPLLAAFIIGAVLFSETLSQQMTSLVAMTGFAGLLWAKLCARLNAWRSRELTLLSTIAAFVLALIGTASLSGVSLNAVDLAMLTGCIGLSLGFVYKSGPCLMTSTLALTVWLLAAIPVTNEIFGFGQTFSEGWTSLLPVLLLGQIAMATRLRSPACLGLSLILAYGWGFWMGTILGFPKTALAGLIFAAGFAHHRIGKAMADSRIFGADWHSWTGVIATLSAALYIQAIWLDPAMNQAVPGWIPTQSWWMVFSGASAALFISSLLRYKYSRITLSGIFILSAAAALLPIAAIRPDLVRETVSTIPGMTAAPGFGLIIGAGLMAAGVAWVVNGLRRMRLGHVIIGAALVGLQVVVLMAPGRANLDTGIIFVTSLIAALCIGGLVAGASLDHARPAPRRL